MMRRLSKGITRFWPPFFRISETLTLMETDHLDAAGANDDPVADRPQALSFKRASLFVLIAGLASLPALLVGGNVVGQVAGLYQLAAQPNPYFHPSYVGPLYLIVPVVVVSAFSLFLLPGAVLALALGQANRIESLLVWSFGYSLLLSIIGSTAAKLLFGEPTGLWHLMGLWLGFALAASLLLAYRVGQGHTLFWPLRDASDTRRLGWIVGGLFVGIILLLPKIFWENFNLDGIEAFEYGRSLTTSYLPRWEILGGAFGFYDNFWLFAYANHWFITLLGPVEASVRLPFLLYLALLFAVVLLLIEHGQARKLAVVEEAVLWLGLALFAVVQAYNTTYEPFYSDLAETAVTDTLGVLVFLAAVYSLWAGRSFWFVIFALMAYFATPGGLLLLLLLGGFTFLSGPSQRWLQLRLIGAVVLACIVSGLLYEYVYVPFTLGDTASQFSSTNLLRRLYPPTFTEWMRVNALLFTTGLIPAFCLFLARRSDWRSWTLAGVGLGYFGILYLQSWSSLHQFTPVMVIPVVVFWRLYLGWKLQIQKWAVPALAATVTFCLVLSMPRHFQINLAVREFGQATEYRVGDYERDYQAAAAGSGTLSELLPDAYRFAYPNQPWGADEYSWIYYATREKPSGTETNYLVQAAIEPPPAGFTQVANKDSLGVYVKDLERWQRDRDLELLQVVVSPLYEPILRQTYRFFRGYTEDNQG